MNTRQKLFYPLTQEQHSLLAASLVADASMELTQNNVTPRVRFCQSQDRAAYVDWWGQQLKPWAGRPRTRDRFDQRTGRTTRIREVDTFNDAAFWPYYELFYGVSEADFLKNRIPRGVKALPSVPWLSQNITADVLGHILMQDGSKKGATRPELHLHLQGLGYRSVARFSWSLIQQHNIVCYPKIDTKTKDLWIIYIPASEGPKYSRLCDPLISQFKCFSLQKSTSNTPPSGRKPDRRSFDAFCAITNTKPWLNCPEAYLGKPLDRSDIEWYWTSGKPKSGTATLQGCLLKPGG